MNQIIEVFKRLHYSIFAVVLLIAAVLPVPSANAMSFSIVSKEYRTISYAKQVMFHLSATNAAGLEYGVSMTVYYVDGSTSGTIHTCRTDGTGCGEYSAGWYNIEAIDPAYEKTLVSYIEFKTVKSAGGGEPELLKKITINDMLPPTDPGDGGSGGGTDPNPTDPGDGGTDPGDGGTGGGTDPGDCPACELLSCPGWEELAELFANEIGKEIPPPPDWEEVAGIFGDELVPRMSEEIIDEFINRGVPAIGDEMTDVLEDVLQHPEPPSGIVVDIPPELNGTEGLSKPQPTDSAPPAQNITFDNVPDIPVTPDQTGGIDLSKADPIDTLPHQAPDYKPQPGKETGGFKPQTKPTDQPVPSTPMPGTSTSPPPKPNQTAPGTGTGTPKPDVTQSPLPVPTLPMPGN